MGASCLSSNTALLPSASAHLGLQRALALPLLQSKRSGGKPDAPEDAGSSASKGGSDEDEIDDDDMAEQEGQEEEEEDEEEDDDAAPAHASIPQVCARDSRQRWCEPALLWTRQCCWLLCRRHEGNCQFCAGPSCERVACIWAQRVARLCRCRCCCCCCAARGRISPLSMPPMTRWRCTSLCCLRHAEQPGPAPPAPQATNYAIQQAHEACDQEPFDCSTGPDNPMVELVAGSRQYYQAGAARGRLASVPCHAVPWRAVLCRRAHRMGAAVFLAGSGARGKRPCLVDGTRPQRRAVGSACKLPSGTAASHRWSINEAPGAL